MSARGPKPGTEGPLRVFLDDQPKHRRPKSDDWVEVESATEAIELLETGRVVALSLDFDLGKDEEGSEKPDGYEVVKHLEYRLKADGVDLWPTEYIQIHSANSTGVDRMAAGIEANTKLELDRTEQKRTWRAR